MQKSWTCTTHVAPPLHFNLAPEFQLDSFPIFFRHKETIERNGNMFTVKSFLLNLKDLDSPQRSKLYEFDAIN